MFKSRKNHQPRLLRRKSPRIRHQRRAGRLMITLGVVLTLTFAGWVGMPALQRFLAKQTLFTISRVEFRGCQRVQEVELRARLPKLEGDNLFALDYQRLSSQLELHPWVEKASLHQRLPDRLLIKINERIPVALLKADRLWALDAQARLLPLNRNRGALDLPILSYQPTTLLNAGVIVKAESLRNVLAALETLHRRLPDLWQEISEVVWNQQGEVAFYAKNYPITMLLGKTLEWQQLLNLYTYLIYRDNQASLNDVACVDLRFTGQVIVRSKSANADTLHAVAVSP